MEGREAGLGFLEIKRAWGAIFVCEFHEIKRKNDNKASKPEQGRPSLTTFWLHGRRLKIWEGRAGGKKSVRPLVLCENNSSVC